MRRAKRAGPCKRSDRALEKCVFLFVPPRKKKSAPEDGTPACTPHILQSWYQDNQGMIRGQSSGGGEL